ncbi:MAG: ankyrin repeat domain-containing protein [Sphingomonas sp.]
MSRTLTPRTNLDTLRKDAKRWLKALRAGDAEARSRLLAAWPRAPAEPGLRDAQHALALDYGCESWVALKAAIGELAMDGKSYKGRVEQVLGHGWGGDLVAARRILGRYPDIAKDSLFAAATCGDLAEVERRLARDPRGAKRTGGPGTWTALAYVTYGRLDPVNAVAIARRLLEAGADPNFQFDDGWGNPFKILTGAVGLGEGAKPSHPQVPDLVELLIAAGADPYDLQALYDVSIVGADTAWYDLFWRHCEARGVLDAWRVAGKGRLGEWKGLSTLDYLLGNAVGQNHLVRAEWLLARGASADTLHAYSGQPVHALAQLSGYLEMAALLERHRARPAVLAGAQAFRAACLRGDAAEARALLAADPGLVRDPAPLLAAAEFGNAPAVALLLALGAPVGGLDHVGISALHRAVQSGSLEAVNLLIAAGADVDLRERKWRGTPFSWSAVLGKPHLSERLAPLSHDVRALARLGRLARLEEVLRAEPALANHLLPDAEAPTPLFCLPDEEGAAADVVRLLLAQGADPTLRHGQGRSAIEAARSNGLDEAADLMEAHSNAR